MTREQKKANLLAQNESRRKRRAEAIKKGMCRTCCIREARPDLKSCASCGDTNGRNKTARLRVELGVPPGGDLFLVCCQSIGYHRDDCRSPAARRPIRRAA